jgi:probable phosphoglycerate mutase
MPLFPDPAPSTVPHDTDWIFAHCDGGSRGNPGPSGFGAVITDRAGEVIAELSQFLGIRTNNFAEYAGLLAVLDWAIAHGYKRLKVVSDSELMVKQIQGKYKVNSPDLKILWDQAKAKTNWLDNFEITHALRHKNQAADALANQAMDRGMRRNVSMLPEEIVPPRPVPPRPASSSPGKASGGKPAAPKVIEPPEPAAHPARPAMLRGFSKDGVIQILGGHSLPDGVFVKIIRE